MERRNGQIWVGGETGLARWTGAKFEPVADVATLGMEGVDAMLEDQAGDLWVASAHPLRGGAGRLTAAGVLESYTHSDGLAHPSVSSLYEDHEGGIWFASGFGRQGAACRLFHGAWSRLTKNDGLASDRARLVFEDSHGRFWVASEVDGTAVRSGGKWRVLTAQRWHDGLGSEVRRGDTGRCALAGDGGWGDAFGRKGRGDSGRESAMTFEEAGARFVELQSQWRTGLLPTGAVPADGGAVERPRIPVAGGGNSSQPRGNG